MADAALAEKPADQAVTDQAAADKAAADKAAADKAAADATATGQTPEQLAAAQAAADEAARKAADQAKPETYELTLPEQSPLQPVDLDDLRAEAKALGLTAAQAKTLVQVRHEAAKAAVEQTARDLAAIKADPVLGGAHYDTTVKHVEAGMRWVFGGDEVAARKALTERGLGNDLVLVRGLARIGKATAEDTPVGGSSSATPEKKSAAEVLYGTK